MHHLLAPREGRASAIIARALDLPSDLVAEWIALGAVYCERARLPFDLRVEKGDYLRVHSFPRRYGVDRIDWPSRVVADLGELIVVDKPAGIPVHPTVDNGREHCLGEFSRALGCPLFAPHRLDVAADGLLALARAPRAQAKFQRWQAEGMIRKVYSTFTDARLPEGALVHWLMPSRRAPRVVSPRFVAGWQESGLVVEACRAVEAPLVIPVYRPRLRLLTGRTHQIRAQLHVVGCPILGDFLYGSPHGREHFRLRSVELTLPGVGEWRLEEPRLLDL